MTFDWYDAWPCLAFGALLYLAAIAQHAREMLARRAARRRARVLLAPEPDLTGCIQRAALRNAERGTRNTETNCTIEVPSLCMDAYCFDDTPHRKH